MAFRLSGQYVKRDGYYSDGYDDEDSHGLRGQFRLDLGSIDLNVMADYGHVGGQGSGGTIMPLLDGDNRLGPSDPAVIAAYLARPPTPPVPQIIATDDGFMDNDYYGAIATLNADLGFATLTVIPAWRKTDLDFESYASSFLIDVIEESEQFSIEARLANQVERVKWVLGAYYFDEDVEADQFYDQASNGTAIDSDLTTESYALFGEATFSVTDRVRLTGGLRYTSDNKTQDTEAHTYPFVGFVPPAFPNFTPIILDIPTFATTDVDFGKTTWKVGVEFDASEQSMLYGTISTGFKSGILYSALGQNYSAPEEMTAYTLGSKNRFLDNQLQLNIEAFYWDYKDQQISHLGPVQVATTPGGPIYGPVFLTENAGAATIFGHRGRTALEAGGGRTAVAGRPVPEHRVRRAALPGVLDDRRGAGHRLRRDADDGGASPTARIYDVDCSGQPLVRRNGRSISATSITSSWATAGGSSPASIRASSRRATCRSNSSIWASRTAT